MEVIVELPPVVAFANWVWGADTSENISPEICLRSLPLLKGDCFSGLFVKCIGIAIIVASCLNKVPVMMNIINAKSAAGITQFGIYTDILVVSNAALYGILNSQPFTAFGENVALTIQNLIIVFLMWDYKDDPKVTTKQKVLASLFYAVYIIGVTQFLPPGMYYILMTSVLPLALFARGSQVYEAYRIKHTGSNALITHVMNFLGSSIRILTTLKEVGWDLPMLSGFILSVTINGLIIMQIWIYHENTQKFLRELEEKKQA